MTFLGCASAEGREGEKAAWEKFHNSTLSAGWEGVITVTKLRQLHSVVTFLH